MRIARVIVGLGFTAIFIFVVWLTAFDLPIESRVECNRENDACVITQRLLTGQRTGVVRLSSLWGAEVRVANARRGSPRTMLYLVSAKDAYYVADYRSSQREEAQADADRLNRFLRNDDAEVAIVRNDRWMYAFIWVLLAGCTAILGALWWVLMRKQDEQPPEHAFSAGGHAA
jgi:hypothetical protein